MRDQRLHTPEGVRDIYGEELLRKEKLEETILQNIHTFGYRDIETPTFEYFDIFSKEIGTTPSRELYKFFDKEGDTLVLRPDFTPSVARCVVKYFSETTSPVRLCYKGNVFSNTSSLQGKLKEGTQIGAELMGVSSQDGSRDEYEQQLLTQDAEMIALVVKTLLACGLQDFQVSIGEVNFFSSLCQEACLDEGTKERLRELIHNKNLFGAEELLNSLNNVPDYALQDLLAVLGYTGGEDVLECASKVHSKRAQEAVGYLSRLLDLLKAYGVDRYVSFDLSMISKYNYYTGIILKAYTYGVGDAIVKGGRYDKLLSFFGKDIPAVGFVTVLDDVLTALQSQGIGIPVQQENILYVYEVSDYEEALKELDNLRKEGAFVTALPVGDAGHFNKDAALSQGFYHRLFIKGKGESAQEVMIG
ncbi:MAG: ATP phosphoribosyltransferase regulatory subunit [Lachnospiraceae bacterium]|nr:ATP phosphoribosyltransferase regulatory subunit [Lachnospiraceae bacterium]